MGANGQFDRSRNSLELKIASKKPIQDALSRLEPENVTMAEETLRITSVMDEKEKAEGAVTLGAKVMAAGRTFLIDTSRADEGVWLENAEGEIALRADVLASTATTLDCVFSGFIEPGEYRFVVATRMGDPSLSAPAVAKRKVKVFTTLRQ